MRIIGMHFRLGINTIDNTTNTSTNTVITKGDYKFSKVHRILSYDYYDLAIQAIIDKGTTSNMMILYCNEKEDNDTINDIIEKLKKKYPMILFTKMNDTIDDWVQMILLR